MGRRARYIMVVAALALITALGALWVPESAPERRPTPTVPSTPSSHTGTPPIAGATPVAGYGDLYDPILSDQRGEIAAAAAGQLPVYTIEATMTPPEGDAPATVRGTVEVRYVNITGEPLHELPFRLYPNLRQYEAGRMEISDVTVDARRVAPIAPALYSVPSGTPVATPSVDEADLILVQVPLPEPIVPGATVTVSMSFTTSVPVDPPDASGLFRYHPDRGAWALSGWYPMIAGYHPELGWDIDPPAAWSDVVFGTAALYDVTISAPEDLVIVTPGIEASPANERTRRFVSGPAREFAVVADPTLVSTSTDVGGTSVTVYHSAGSAAGAEQVLGWTARALEIYGDMFGPYPYTELGVVAVPDLIGFEFSGMIWLGEAYVADPEGSGSRPGATELLIAHEVAHQWWYGVVGSDPHRQAFLDEGLAEYSAVMYFEHVHGDDAANAQVGQGLTLPYAAMLVTSGDAVANQPATAFPDASSYYATTYDKAGLGFAAIREAIGDDAYFAALRTYAAANRFGMTAPADLLSSFETASGEDLDDLWRLWFESASGSVRIVIGPEGVTPTAPPSD